MRPFHRGGTVVWTLRFIVKTPSMSRSNDVSKDGHTEQRNYHNYGHLTQHINTSYGHCYPLPIKQGSSVVSSMGNLGACVNCKGEGVFKINIVEFSSSLSFVKLRFVYYSDLGVIERGL